MKHFFVTVGIMLTASFAVAQNDGANKEKYWKFRSDLREKFIKIGPNEGESLTSGTLKPLDCIDNDPSDGSPNAQYGVIQWGDGMIRHGHYLGLLATEYRLLKNAGKDVTGVLNELYFALKAINRLDNSAESEQSIFYFENQLNPSLNGFAMREDIPEFFAANNWATDPLHARCSYAVSYTNNNAMAVQDGSAGLEVKFNSYQNTPSLDQISSLMVGFRLIHKLVDEDELAHPTGELQGFNIVTETKNIVHRLMTYAEDHNWFLIDVNGWPVNNGGGDLVLTATPLSIAATIITGQVYDLTMTRKPIPYRKIQECLTGYGINAELSEEERFAICTSLGDNPAQVFAMNNWLVDAGNAGPFNNQTVSRFQEWQWSGTGLGANVQTNLLASWLTILPPATLALDQTLENLSLAIDTYTNIEKLEDLGIADYTETILFNCGVASSLWSPNMVATWAGYTQNRQLELIDGVLKGIPPIGSQGFYRAFLDQMTYAGPYEMEGKNYTGNSENIWTYTNSHPNGWASEYRWTHPEESVGDHNGKKGMYSAIDYMLFHNLYWLSFNNGIQMTETSELCPCNAAITEPAPAGANNYQLDAIANLNAKLAYLPTCVPSALAPTFNMVTSAYTIQPKFSNYVDWSIFTTKYQLQNATIETGGALTVKTHLVVCDNATVNVKTGSFFYVDKSYTQINTNAAIDVSGELRVRQGTELLVKGKLRLKNGGKLIIEPGAKLTIDYYGVLEYYNGATIETIDATSSIILKGVIKTMDATTFQIINSGGGTQSAKLYIDGPTTSFQAQVPAYFKLEGKGINDAFIVLRNSAQLKVQDTEIITFRVADCTVEVNGGTSIKVERPYYSYRVKYNSLASNGGMTVTGSHVFNECQFINVPIKAPMNIQSVSNFAASDCSFSATSTALNPLDLSLVKVTGMGVSMSNCVFTGSKSYCLESSSLTQPSTITGCTFNNLASSAVGAVLIGIQDVSNIEYKVSNSTFQKLQYGINKTNGKLSLKCNYFNNNNINNLRILTGCLLNMSINDLAGYNVLNKTLQNKNIELSRCSVNLKNGYNFIEACTNTIYGSVSYSCTLPNCTLDFANNQWNVANSVPAPSLFQILSINDNPMQALVSTVTPKPACGFYDGPIVIGPPKTKSTFDTDGMPIIYSAITADSIRLDDAIVAGMEKMTSYDSIGNDLEAVERFNEAFTSDVDLSDSLTNQLLWFTISHMKSSLENAVAHGQITIGQNTTAFETHVAMYTDALMQLSAQEIDEYNYVSQFYHEIDKAHLLRVIGHSDKGLNILNGLEACGLDSAEQAHLNYWKQEFEKDLVIEEIGFTAIDSVIVIDTSAYLDPALVVNAYSFGAVINNLNDIQYPNCSFFEHRDKKIGFGSMQVFPNPATDEVRISLNHPMMEGEGIFQIQQADGRAVLTKKIDTNEATGITLSVADWNPGVYQIKYRSPNGVVSTAQLVVQ
jgi:hypothetical protein